ncbi:unnamed protein product, partial [Pylaiella littoralis]
GARVHLNFGANGAKTEVSCTCAMFARWRVPSCDIITVGREANKADEVMTLIDKAYHLDTYRGVYEDDR